MFYAVILFKCSAKYMFVNLKAFDYNYWLDDSESAVEDVEKYRITRIKLEKIVQPGDDETQRIFNRQKQDLRARNEYICFTKIFFSKCYK